MSDHTKTFAILALAATVILWGCGGGQAPASHDDEWQAEVLQALAEIEQHGLPQWAEWGRENREIICYAPEQVPDGNLGYTWQFTDADGHAEYRIALGDKWLALSLSERGHVLLHELFHARIDMGHPQELWELLDSYDNHQEAAP